MPPHLLEVHLLPVDAFEKQMFLHLVSPARSQIERDRHIGEGENFSHEVSHPTTRWQYSPPVHIHTGETASQPSDTNTRGARSRW